MWLSLAVLFFAVSLSVAVFLVQRHVRSLEQRLARQAESIDLIQNDVAALCTGAGGLVSQLVKVHQNLRHLGERQDQVELRNTSERPYSKAIRLVQTGASSQDLVTSCGLARGEADLIVQMHGESRRA